jgi:hypothetical protein
MTAFWNIVPCSLVEVDRRFRVAYCIRAIIYTVRISQESPCAGRRGGGVGYGAVRGGKCTGGWIKGLLLVENNMTHQGVTLLHTDRKHLAVESSV